MTTNNNQKSYGVGRIITKAGLLLIFTILPVGLILGSIFSEISNPHTKSSLLLVGLAGVILIVIGTIVRILFGEESTNISITIGSNNTVYQDKNKQDN